MNKKKILLMFIMIVFVTVILASCKNTKGKQVMIAVNNPVDKLVYNEGEPIVITGEKGLSYFEIFEKGVISDVITYEGQLPNTFTQTPEGIRTYELQSNGFIGEYHFYIRPATVPDETKDDIVLTVFRFKGSTLLLNQGQAFRPDDIEVYIVRRGSMPGEQVEMKLGSEFEEGVFTTEYSNEPIRGKGFVTKTIITINFQYEGYETTFNAYVGVGDRPIHKYAANFWDYVLFIPVSFLISFFSSIMSNNFALGILFTTIIIRTIAWPIYAKGNDSTMKLKLAEPDLQRVQAKYAHRRDPQAKQQMQMETMAIYKKHGISVFGCLLPFLQMPIFIAMYNSVRRITLEGGMFTHNVSNYLFLGFDLSRGSDGIKSAILAGLVGITMGLLQYISMQKPSYAKNTSKQIKNQQQIQTEKTMKMVSYFMIIMMVAFSFQNNAIAVYWIFGNIFSLGQTIVNRRLQEKKHKAIKEKQLLG